MEAVTTPQQLDTKVKEKETTIVIEGSLKGGVTRIMVQGKIAWFVAICSFAVAAVYFVLTSKMATESSSGFPVIPVILVVVGVISGFFACTNKLRGYKATDQSDDGLILRRK